MLWQNLARQISPKSLVIGLAPDGGRLPAEAKEHH